MSQERQNNDQARQDQNKETKKRQPYFDPSIPDEPLMSDEDTAVNASNAKKEY